MVNSYNIKGTATIAASAGAGTVQAASLTYDPRITAVVNLQVPSTQIWKLQDIYIVASADAGTSNPQLRVYKNFSTIMGDTGPLGNFIITSNARPPALPVVPEYLPVEVLSIDCITTTANDATADSIVFYITTQVNETRR